jgi:glycosyltransferase involved in cell wall biosynthesis
MQKTKILYIITKADVGGAQKYVNDLTQHLDKNQFDAKILYGGKDIKWLSNKIRPWVLFLNDWLAIIELIKIFKEERPDVIHLNSSKAGVVGAIAAAIANVRPTTNNRQRIRMIFTAHGWVFNPTNALSRPVRWLYIFLHKFAALFQNTIICVSEYDYHLALRHHIAPKEKLVTIHNGIDPDIKFLSKKTAREKIAQKLNLRPTTYDLRPDSLWIGSLGRLVKEKNYETFVAAASLIPNAHFFIIGSGDQKEKIQSRISSAKLENRFFIIDPTGNDAIYLKAFDMFVMTSIKEGLPYVLLEAMAAELPIVVTDAGGIPEMIKNHENGLMVTQRNPEMLAKALQGLIENKNIARELTKNARHIVQTKFSLEEMVRKTERVYKENL